MNILNIILISIFLALIIYIILSKYLSESILENVSNIYYMNKKELEEYLINDEDNYYKDFSDKDFKARHVNNLDEYYNNIRKACIDISDDNKNILNKCINKANYKLNKYQCIGFDGSKCSNLEWKIGLVRDKWYEEGYPHTRNNLIIIPISLLNNKNQLISTLIHEKIHVYQKTYPEDIEQYLKENGFTKYKLRKDYNNTRSNPDMDEWIYKNNKDEIMMAEYFDNPTSIMDVKTIPINSSKYEHPFKYMAYDITNHI